MVCCKAGDQTSSDQLKHETSPLARWLQDSEDPELQISKAFWMWVRLQTLSHPSISGF